MTKDVGVELFTVAAVPLICTTFSSNVLLKLVPVIVTSVPGFPCKGLTDVIDVETACLVSGISFLQEDKIVMARNSRREILINGGLTARRENISSNVK